MQKTMGIAAVVLIETTFTGWERLDSIWSKRTNAHVCTAMKSLIAAAASVNCKTGRLSIPRLERLPRQPPISYSMQRMELCFRERKEPLRLRFKRKEKAQQG
jgi:hypothetical protein